MKLKTVMNWNELKKGRCREITVCGGVGVCVCENNPFDSFCFCCFSINGKEEGKKIQNHGGPQCLVLN
jgi:hypothetical protein